MLNLYSLMFSFIYKINSKEKPLQMLKQENETNTMELRNLLSSIEALRAMTPTTSLYSDSTSEGAGGGLFDESTSTAGWGEDSTTDGLFSTTAAAAALISGALQRLKCYNMTVKCSKPRRTFISAKNLATTLMLLNVTTPSLVPPSTSPLPTTLPMTTPTSSVTWTTTEATTTTTTSPWTTLPPSTTATEAILTTERTTTRITEASTTSTLLTSPPTTRQETSQSTTGTSEATTNKGTPKSTSHKATTHKGTSEATLSPLETPKNGTKEPPINTTKLTTTTTTTTEAPKPEEDNFFYTTDEDEGSYDYGEVSASSDAPENNSYSDYTDYSADPSAGPEIEDFDDQDTTEQADDPLAKVLEQVDEMEENKTRRKRALGDAPIWRTSKYSRRHRNDTAVSQPGRTTDAVNTPPPSSRWPIYWPPYRPTTPSTTTTRRPAHRIISKEEWENLVRPFARRTTPSTSSTTTTTTTTRRPRRRFRTTTPQELPSSTWDYTSTTESASESTSPESTTNGWGSSSSSSSSSTPTEEEDYAFTDRDGKTPYFIGYGDIAEIGSTIYYDSEDSEYLETCIITVCPNRDDIFGTGFSTTDSPESGGSTASADSKHLTTVKLTPLERKQKRLREVQLAIKQIQTNLTTMCWETSLGQELSKVIVFDGVSAEREK